MLALFMDHGIKDQPSDQRLGFLVPMGVARLSRCVVDQRVGERRVASVEVLDERMMRLEKSIVSVLSILKKIVATPQGAQAAQHVDTQE